MPIISNIRDTENRELAVLLSEAERRGIKIPSIQKRVPFPKDSNGYFVKQDGTKFGLTNEESVNFIESDAVLSALISGRGGSKALAIDTPILTTNGWKTMGTVVVGDYVFGFDGTPTKIIDVSPIYYNHDCYKLVFSDKSEIIADAEHLWFTWTYAARKAYGRSRNPRTHPSIVTTREIKNTVSYCKRGDVNHSIHICFPLEFPSQVLPIDPYVFGFWLGDGTSRSGRFSIGEKELVSEIRACGYEIKKESSKYSYVVSIKGEPSTFRNKKTGRMERNPNSFFGRLRSLNVLQNKHIPNIYKYSSYEQRLALLQGLMDSDGSVDSRGHLKFDNTNLQLSRDVFELVNSLGIRATIQSKRAKLYDKDCGTVYGIAFYSSIPSCRLKRKLKRIKSSYTSVVEHRYIKRVKKVASVPVRCITVDSNDSLFLVTSSFIATHNSASGAQKALKKIEQGYSGAIFNPRFEDLKTSTWAEFKQWVPWDMVIPRQKYRGNPEWEPTQPFKLNFMSGAEVWFKGLKEPDSARGPNINWLWYDEAGNDPDGLAWQIALASVRVGDDIQAWITTTPKGRQHWIYKFFVQQDIPDDAKEAFEEASQGREFIEMFYMSIYDNKDNLHPVYFANLLAAYPTGWLREQEIYGRFVDAGGAFGDRKWFTERQGGVLAQPPSVISGRIRFWDLAASEKKVAGRKLTDPDETVGSLVSWQKGGTVVDNNGFELKVIGRFFLEDQVCGYWEWARIKQEILETAKNDGPYVKIWIEQEPAAGGKNQIAELTDFIHKELGHQYQVQGALPRDWGDRVMAANTWFAEAAQGLWSVVYGNWTNGFFDQLDTFDGSDKVHDDRITSVSGARHCLAPTRLWQDIKFLKI